MWTTWKCTCLRGSGFIHSGTKSVKKERFLFPLLDNDRLCKTHTFLSSVLFSRIVYVETLVTNRCLRISLDLMIFLIEKHTHFLLSTCHWCLQWKWKVSKEKKWYLFIRERRSQDLSKSIGNISLLYSFFFSQWILGYNCNINARFVKWIFYLSSKAIYFFRNYFWLEPQYIFLIVMRLLLTMSCCDKTNAFVRHWVWSCAIESELFRTGYAKQESLFVQKLNFYRKFYIYKFLNIHVYSCHFARPEINILIIR